MLNDLGILGDSVRYYHEPDEFTARHLYHAPHSGSYHCDGRYQFGRTPEECMAFCQAILVDAGALRIQYRGEERTAEAGMLLLLDCRDPHRYHAITRDMRMRWFHIAGSDSLAYVNHIIEEHGFVLQTAKNAAIEPCCADILRTLADAGMSPYALSTQLHTLLGLLASLKEDRTLHPLEQTILDSVRFIETHYAEDDSLTIDALAGRAAMSSCYYVRKFREYQHTTPHQFLMTVRLRAAKEQLSTTARSIEEIAFRCGFCSTSHFVMTFRRSTGMTPMQFRTTWK